MAVFGGMNDVRFAVYDEQRERSFMKGCVDNTGTTAM
jgi:hypothetical protein